MTRTPRVEFNLTSTQVSDAGLDHLAGLSGLRTLDLRALRVTEASAANLQNALPKLEISGQPFN